MTAPHFWTLRHVDGLSTWDPDEQPGLHQSGYGHAFLELYARMRHSGQPVTIGERIPRHARSVVACLEELSEWHRQGIPRHNLALSRALLARNPPLVMIRNDVHPHIRSPLCVALEVMPTRASIEDPGHQRWLPLLPQRGLIVRDSARPSRISTVGIKAFGDNLPAWLPTLTRRLEDHGIRVRVDDGVQGSWADFEELDAVLCTQHQGSLGDARRKPATKLINAWAAGVIPICEPHPGYAELARPGVDSLFAGDPDSMLDAIEAFNSGVLPADDMFEASRRRGADFSADSVVPLWSAALEGVAPRGRWSIVAELIASATQVALGAGASRRVVRVLAR